MANARGGFDGVQGSSSACDDASRAFDDATSVRSVSWAPSPVPRPRDDRAGGARGPRREGPRRGDDARWASRRPRPLRPPPGLARAPRARFDAAAALGDAAGQYNLGLAYLAGDGVRLNKSRAAKCFRDAADQDFPPGLHNRGMCYAFGTGVPKDHARAIELITRAAALGEPNAAFALGQCYRTGTFGVAADARKARACFGRAAALGHPDAAALVAGDDGAA
ncbi:hypothetical protein SO694_00164043 [Aureococcus anophagefferens]|uniref:Sel1 repeat family protein n=1 Tax=Aureococcus anophagefferens TaxID=44056 RepID=A0ABR1G5W4_AURAN